MLKLLKPSMPGMARLLWGLLIVAASSAFTAPDVHAKAQVCGVDKGADASAEDRNAADLCENNPTGTAGYSQIGNYYEYTIPYAIDGNELAERLVKTCVDGEVIKTSGTFKLVSNIDSEFFMSSSSTAPWSALIPANDNNSQPSMHLLESLTTGDSSTPGERFFVGYTTEYVFKKFTTAFRGSTAIWPKGTLVRIGVRNSNVTNQLALDDTNFR